MKTRTMKQQAADHRKKLKRMQIELQAMSSDWADSDGFYENMLGNLASQFNSAIQDLAIQNVRDGY